jgi:hypothetical protein
MTTATVASRLIELCTEGKFIRAQNELYDTNIKRIESDGSISNGLSNMNAKEEQFLNSLDNIQRISFSEPLIAGNYFSVILQMEVEIKNIGYRKFEEVCVYQVANGKIIFEQFFRG